MLLKVLRVSIYFFLYFHLLLSHKYFYDQRLEAEPKECNVARKVQKADREKLRRDRLNEQFMELGNTLGKYTLANNVKML